MTCKFKMVVNDVDNATFFFFFKLSSGSLAIIILLFELSSIFGRDWSINACKKIAISDKTIDINLWFVRNETLKICYTSNDGHFQWKSLSRLSEIDSTYIVLMSNTSIPMGYKNSC